MKCSKCGKLIANDSNFCEYCGAVIKEISSTEFKRVDIRWALLPAMLISTYAIFVMWSHMNYSPSYITESAPIAICPPVILFLVTLWYGIKKKVVFSFVLIIGAFLLSCCGMFFDIVNHPEYYEYSRSISWENGNSYRELELKINGEESEKGLLHGDEWNDVDRNLKSFQESISQKLQQEGATNITSNDAPSAQLYAGGGTSWVETYNVILLLLMLLYLIYAFIAYKKNLKF